MKTQRLLTLILILGWMTAACGPVADGLSLANALGPQAWFDSPLPGTICYPPHPCGIVGHGGDPSGIQQFEFRVNGGTAMTFPSPDNDASLVTMTYDWTPPGEGLYTLELRAQNNEAGWSDWAQTEVIVTREDEVLADKPEIVTPTATLAVAEEASIEITGLSTNILYYRGAGCGPKDLLVQTHAIDAAGIKVVVLFHRIRSQSDGTSTGYISKSMNPVGADYYEIPINVEGLYGEGTLDAYGNAWLDLQAVIQNNAGDTATRTPVLSNVTVAPCGGKAPPAQPTISIFIFPLVTVTPTPPEVK